MLNLLRNLLIFPGMAGGAWGTFKGIEHIVGRSLDVVQLGPAVLIIGLICALGAFASGFLLHCALPVSHSRH
jgi:hypothetical protein